MIKSTAGPPICLQDCFPHRMAKTGLTKGEDPPIRKKLFLNTTENILKKDSSCAHTKGLTFDGCFKRLCHGYHDVGPKHLESLGKEELMNEHLNLKTKS